MKPAPGGAGDSTACQVFFTAAFLQRADLLLTIVYIHI
jgi:hypothetical protein